MSTVAEPTPPCLAGSRTGPALLSAWQGETAARRLYLAAARTMEDAGLHVIAHALRFTAAQEKEHGAIFRGLLDAGGLSLPAPAEALLPFPHVPQALLMHLIRAESDEAEKLYPHHARIAAAEGFPRIAAAFLRIGETEALHARRFRQYLKALDEGSLFRDEQRLTWLCLACGEFHPSFEAPYRCPACGGPRGHFIRSNFYPFALQG